MKDNQAKYPQLRFKGFVDPWEQRKLSDLTERVTRKNKNNESSRPLTISAQDGLIDQNDFFDKQIASRDVSGYFLVKNGEFAYNKSYSNGYPWGAIKRLDKYDMGVLSTLYIIFRPTNVFSQFLVSYYDTTRWYKEVAKNAAEGARNHGLLNIAPTDFFSTVLLIPNSIKEQQKIGSFFKQLDDTITLHQRKLAKLKELKQGYLQKLFPKNGSKFPQLRFTGFADAWEQRKLEDISSVITKGTTPKDKSWRGEVNYVKTESIDSNSGNISVMANTSLEEHEGYLKRSQLQDGDVLFTIVGTLGRIGVVKNKDLPANTNQQIAIIRLNNANNRFVFHALKTSRIASFIKSDATIGAQPSLSLWQINGLKIPYPSLKEQDKIGGFFEHLDHLITLHQRKLEKLQELKKGYLQKMFC